jgi:hypothetical protein
MSKREAEIESQKTLSLRALLSKYGTDGLGRSKSNPLDCVIPAWSAGIQVYMDVSGGILANLDAGYPGRHDDDLHFHVLQASVSP